MRTVGFIFVLCVSVSGKQSPRVGIIGGGFAGLGAAGELEKQGIDYVLLEANNRLGGRVYPILDENGHTIQLGAEFINGEENEIFRIAKKLEVLDKKESDYGMFESNISYGIGGTQFSHSDLATWSAFVDPLEDKFTEEALIFPEISVGDIFNRTLLNFLRNRQDRRDIFEGLAKLYRSYYESEWSSPVDELALSNLQEWDDLSNDTSSWMLKGDGFKAILDELVKNINMEKVRLNSKVANIDWSEEDGVTVTLKENEDTLHFDHVIVTVPLGYLKRNPQLFSPKLPKTKREAIKTIGFGSLQKVFLEYDQPFWKKDVETLLTVRIKGLMDEGTDLTDAIRQFQVVESKPNTLLLWLSGKGPAATAKMTNSELSNAITEHLREAFNDTSIPAPRKLHTYNWNNDKLFGGAYSYITPSSYENLEDSYKDMASPVMKNDRPVICFAGEHTHSTLYQTTCGAYETGIREAQRIVAFANKLC